MKKDIITKAILNANASVEMEGHYPSNLAKKLVELQLNGKISKSEVNRIIKESYLK